MGGGQFACLRVMHRGTSELTHQSHYSYRERDRGTDRDRERERDGSPAETETLQSGRQQELQDRKFSSAFKQLPAFTAVHKVLTTHWKSTLLQVQDCSQVVQSSRVLPRGRAPPEVTR